ncbi:MAG: 16S rRNA (adenine(1518)-N(6)/adenine(1519)-N(6))-dimethyltransferase RsmA [Deltaproteobacteria bacterium]|nr:16S rRNA (adenine(1518)-N(6)/adenine(1519)-N(6))-dimethyltransferase RsmA [Deltaproteobacteria bacterium]
MKDPRSVLKAMGLRPSKRLGQNFLLDPALASRVAEIIISEGKGRTVLEVGPGLGALTKPLLDAGAKVIGVELDKRLHERLATFKEAGDSRLVLLNRDILDLKPADLPPAESLIVAGNLPYGISSPFLFWFLELFSGKSPGVFLFQKEFASRVAASPGTKDYGRLTIAVSDRFETEISLETGPESFAPRPSVSSELVILRPKSAPPKADSKLLARVTGMAFRARRKTILNNLSGFCGRERASEVLKSLGIDERSRPEEIAPALYVEMALAFSEKKNGDR